MTKSQKNKIIVIVGLPGSGKTYLAERLVDRKQGVLLDDISNNGGLDKIKEQIAKKMSPIIITDPHLCRHDAQKFAKKFFQDFAKQYEVEWIFFENNVQACLKNIEHRINKGDTRNVMSTIHNTSKSYFIPDAIVPLKIWQKN